ncbi:helix-turn-helix DNA binding domain protein [Arthrobacter phage Mufasa8]|uniref:Helix-turn-helix DNA binding domain protein n=1 Tax=Arthrobacter phage Mufasa8 TaxID=2656526 RepID=A0A649VMF0_9CAUD|nr:DNA binding protein [Arthrobacter phage Mufasa8]QGJ93518.1 helix-turn-helix DNA binding domain protein [Arthrobacter phage Mufasa8]
MERGRGRPKADQEEFLQLHHQGLSASQIAERMGCTARTIVRLRARTGVAAPAPTGKRVDAEWHAKVRELHAEGLSQTDIARLTGVTPQTVARHHPDTGWDRPTIGRYGRAVKTLNSLPSHLEAVQIGAST